MRAKLKRQKTLFWVAGALLVIGALIYEHPEILPGGITKTSFSPLFNKIQILKPTDIPTPVLETVKSNDPLVKCSLNECGTIEMKSSQCKLSGCCVVGIQAKVMTDKAQCESEQKAYLQQNKQNTTSKESALQNAKNNANYWESQTCRDQAEIESKRCLDTCMNEYNESAGICRYTSDSLGWEREKFSECLNEVSDIHDQCGDGCLATFNTKQNECLEKQKQQ